MPSPRRHFLRRLGAAVTVTSLTGCLDDSASTPGGTQTGSPSTSPPRRSAQNTSPAPSEQDDSPTESERDRLDENPGDGVRWAFHVGKFAGGPQFGHGLVFVASSDGVVRGLDPEGTVQWRYETPNPIGGEGPGVEFGLYENSLVAVGGEYRGTEGVGYTAHCLDPATGTERWTHGIGGGFGGVLGAAAGGIAFSSGDDIAGPSGDWTFLIEHDGTARWSTPLGDALAVADGGGHVYLGSWGEIGGFDAESGEEAWSVEATPTYFGMTADETTLYAIEHRDDDGPFNRLAARDGACGELRWETDWRVSSIQQAGDDGILAGGERLVSYAPSGDQRWEYETGGSARGPVNDGVLYANTDDGPVAISLTDGTVQWRATDAASARPRAYGSGVVVSEDYEMGRFVALDAATGEVRWTFDGFAVGMDTLAVGDGSAYVATKGGRLLARTL
jgi:outer membrane protein assembly factor BamB